MPRYKKRKDGRYVIKVTLGLDEKGKRIRKAVYGKNPKEVEQKAEDIKLSMRKGLDLNAAKDSFGEWARKWLRLKETEVSSGCLTAYESGVNHFEQIDLMPISEIRSSDMQDIILDLADYNPYTHKPSSKRTLENVKSVAVQVFNLAIENRVVDYNPAKAIRIPKGQPQEHRRALTSEEQQWIVDTPHNAKTPAMIMMYAGLRRGELIPLTWNDIDLVEGTISVNKSVIRDGNKFILKEGAKTKAGVRVVYIPDILIDYLKELKRKSIYVCCNSKGAIMTLSGWRRMWESYIYDLNLKYGYDGKINKYTPEEIPLRIPNFTPHWLRHTFATLLYMAGVDVVDAKNQLGHSDITTTLNIYTHLDKEHKKLSMTKLNSYIKGSKIEENGGSK